jgi:hypothetical protein
LYFKEYSIAEVHVLKIFYTEVFVNSSNLGHLSEFLMWYSTVQKLSCSKHFNLLVFINYFKLDIQFLLIKLLIQCIPYEKLW